MNETFVLPRPRLDGKKGRPTAAESERYQRELEALAVDLKEIQSGIDFRSSARGWCYILENERGLSKGDFDVAQKAINECRKRGYLPINFCLEDEGRSADNLEKLDDPDPRVYAAEWAQNAWDSADWYQPVSFWNFQPVYLELWVEKVDLKSLFNPVCQRYSIPLVNASGWSDMNSRALAMLRFRRHEEEQRRCVLLYCGDFDPVGLHMSATLKGNFRSLEGASMLESEEEEIPLNWSAAHLTVDRFGLNEDFITANNLSWIDGLTTGSGGDLGSPSHPDHHRDYVQDYIHRYGKRKVEANALVVRPEEARQLCQEAVEQYLDQDGISAYHQWRQSRQEQVRTLMPKEVRRVFKGKK